MSLAPFLAWAHVRRRALQSILTVGGVAVGVAVLIVALSLTNGFVDELLSSTLRATPHLSLSTFDPSTFVDARPEDLADLSTRDGVVAVAPFVSTDGLIVRRANRDTGVSGRQGFTQFLGIDPSATPDVMAMPELRAYASELAQPGHVILGASLASRLGVWTGDEVWIQDSAGHRGAFQVAGTFRVGNELIDGLVAYASMATVQEYLEIGDRISGFHVRLTDPSDAEQIGADLARDAGLRATTWSRLFGGLVGQLRLQKAVISVVVFMIVVVAAMGIANVLVLTVAEKTREIALLRTLGTTPSQVSSIFVLEGLMLGGAGTIGGTVLGVAASVYFQFQPVPLPGDLYFITRLPVQVLPWDVAWVAAVSLTTSVVAGIVPARRAASLDPARVLR